MNRQELLNAINSNPLYAKEALSTMYHGKTFCIADNRIDTFKKTRRGAEGYIKKQQSISYYDDMTFSMVTCGSGLEIFEIKENEILDYKTSVKMWYDYIRSIWSKDWIVRYVPEEAERMGVSDQILEYVTIAVNEALTNFSFTHIEEYENNIIEPTEAPEQAETVATESNNTESAITLEIEYNEELNGIELYFSDKPSENVRQMLKDAKFRWHKKGYWYAKKNDTTVTLAESLQSVYKDINAELEATEAAAQPEQAEEVAEVETAEQETQQTEIITTPEGKITVQSIEFIWSESGDIEDELTVNSFAEAETLIKKAAANAPDNGAYDKTKFKITWTDGQTYTGRLDIVYSDMFKAQPLKNHIEAFANMVIENEDNLYTEENKKDYKNFLNTYQLEDYTPQPAPEQPNNSHKGKVLDFSARFQQKQEKEEASRMIDHFTNEILPYMTADDIYELQQAYKSGNDKDIEKTLNRLMIAATAKKVKDEFLKQN